LGTLESRQMLEGAINQGAGRSISEAHAWTVCQAPKVCCHVTTLMLGNADFRVLMAAMTFFGLLVALLLPEGCIDPSLIGPD
jgi:hypothetical protein